MTAKRVSRAKTGKTPGGAGQSRRRSGSAGADIGGRIERRSAGRGSGRGAERASGYRERRPQQEIVAEGYVMLSERGYGFVRTQNAEWPDIFIPERALHGATSHDTVRIGIFTDLKPEQINKESRLHGEVQEVLHHIDPDEVVDGSGRDVEMVLWQNGLDEAFPDDVLREAAYVPQEVSEGELAGRRDCRDMPLVTIDGKDSRDFDDAVYCRREPDGNYFLSVHIADVSHYVLPRTALEMEAFRRGTSVYLPDRVLPMLPFELSNGICSLNEGVTRLTLGCDMTFSPAGRLLARDIYPAYIQVSRRLDYDTVNEALLEHNAAAEQKLAEQMPMLLALKELRDILLHKRLAAGMLNFDFPEIKVVLDEAGRVADIYPRRTRLAESMIEQAMLAANETIAKVFHKLGQPLVHRVHSGPEGEKLLALNQTLHACGYPELGADETEDIHPRDLQQILAQAEGTPEASVLQVMALRSMAHAEYTNKPTGHFGLAAKYYCHFTSPIRRYADLAVHRSVKQFLQTADNAMTAKDLARYTKRAGVQASLRERVAEEAERAAVRMKCCLYMQRHIGEVYPAVISGVAAKAIFLELANGIEGRISVDDLPYDDYVYMPELLALAGKERTYKLGRTMNVRVARVELLEKRIIFTPAEDE